MRKLLLTTFCSMALSLSAYAEVYRSPGFSAEIGTNGVIRNLRFKDMPLAKEIMLNGEYQIPKGVEKHDARFFQTWDYSKKAVFKRDGEKLSFTVKSTLSNKKFKDAADYQVVCVMEPNRISIQSEVTQKIDLQTQLRLFQTHIVMPASLFGRGVQVIRKGQEEFKVLPETYNPKFRLGGGFPPHLHRKGNPCPLRRKRDHLLLYGFPHVGRKRLLSHCQSAGQMDRKTGHPSRRNRLEMGFHHDVPVGMIPV